MSEISNIVSQIKICLIIWWNKDMKVSFTFINLQSWARDNNAAKTWPCMFSGQKLFFFIELCLYSLWQLHLETEALTFFAYFCHWCSICTGALSKCEGINCRACPALIIFNLTGAFTPRCSMHCLANNFH